MFFIPTGWVLWLHGCAIFFRWLADVVVVVCRLFLLLTLIDVTDTFTAWSSLYETHTHTPIVSKVWQMAVRKYIQTNLRLM